ncbi:MAG: alanine racemase [Terrimicrobiaceae bacterium]|nr:alanine racemase [Terrimicrobiaceae bacterium]
MSRFLVPSAARSWVEIDLDALRRNLAEVRSAAAPAGVLAVVKANAYGHGTEPIVQALTSGVDLFGVANLCEARKVRATGTDRPIMILSPCLPAERAAAAAGGFIVTVSSASEALAYAEFGPVQINFKIDTGMGRAGAWWQNAAAELQAVTRLRGLSIHSLSTHLPVSDEDVAFTEEQLRSFGELLEELRPLAPGARVHVLNSAGIFRFGSFQSDIVRAGLVLYGAAVLPDVQDRLSPVLTWKARVTLVHDLPAGASVSYGRTFVAEKPIRTALLGIGYADGFPRQASNRGAHVLVNSTRCPVIGRVTMDQIVVDVSGAGPVAPGDEAVIIGRQGNQEIAVHELAGAAGTIAWDIFTGIKDRVTRLYSTEPSLPPG